jgi:hypothetical protein
MDAGCVRETDVKCIVWERAGAFSRKQKKGAIEESRPRTCPFALLGWLLSITWVAGITDILM